MGKQTVEDQVNFWVATSEKSTFGQERLIANDALFLYADIEDSDQTEWTRRLIWVFVERMSEVRFITVWLNYVL